MSKILVIYPYLNHEPMMYHLVKSLRENGLEVDAVNSFNLQYAVEPLQKVKFQHKIVTLLSKLPLPKWKGVLFTIFNKRKALLQIAEGYDIIDFHSFIAEYDSMIKELSQKKTIKVTFWGSDFYRATADRREQQRSAMKFVSTIQIGTKAMKDDMMEHFGEFESKVSIANFGLQQFDMITEVKKTNVAPQYKIGQLQDKLMVVCGYNGSAAQQHLLLINAFKELPAVLKDKIFLVFPLTYGADADYIKELDLALNQINIPFTLITKHLSEMDMIKLRIETDFVVNIQKTDAFSGSLQQHLFAENLVLVGDWLPYSVLDDHQVVVKRTNLENLSESITTCVGNFDALKIEAQGNAEKMAEISSLKITGQRIAAIYKELQL